MKKMEEHRLVEIMKEKGISLIGDLTLEEKSLAWRRAIKIVLRPRNVSDNTCIRNISKWLVEQCEKGVFDENEIFRRALDFAIEASGPFAKNPYAVFMSIMKKDLGYLK